eukprot:TRINITY_DN171_c0_g1_i1.p1 TRINITY_DN171_c0_g1~~TRINITY_DN171_c0_g1_i1.p1  ORF type:complete len:451 (+),score=108.79 TRINITY_DN171_c0_g1_i1:83-1435(+)
MSKASAESQAFFHRIDPTGHSLYEHLSGLVLKLLDERPSDPVHTLEFYSAEVKQCQLPNTDIVDGATKVNEDNKPQLQELAKKLSLHEVPKKTKKSKAEAAQVAQIPNLFEEAEYLSYIGAGLSQEELFHLHLSMQRLVDQYNPMAIRFFGKVHGVQNDYYVVEAEFKREPIAPPAAPAGDDAEEKAADEEEDGEDGEKKKPVVAATRPEIRKPYVVPEETNVGPNRFTYYVTTKVSEPWIQLPDVTPAQISIARQIRKLMTGRLDAEIQSYPPFPGNEANYLRAQIARISSATYISPNGYYSVPEENEDENAAPADPEVNAEFEEVDVNELAKLESWVHHRRFILPQGRTSYWKPPKEPKPPKEGDEEEEVEEEEAEETKEEGPALLTPIASDQKILSKFDAWSFKRPAQGLVPSKFVPVFVASNYWPGSYTYGTFLFSNFNPLKCVIR